MPGTDIYILGQKYTIKGKTSEKHIQELSKEVNIRINEVLKRFPNITPTKALILTLFNMTEELNTLKTEHDSLTEDLEHKADALVNLFDSI